MTQHSDPLQKHNDPLMGTPCPACSAGVPEDKHKRFFEWMRDRATPIGDESEFDRGYRLGNRDGVEFGREQERNAVLDEIEKRLEKVHLVMEDDWMYPAGFATQEVHEIIKEMRNGI